MMTVKERMVRKFQLGLDCEMLVCGSCRLIAEEMASMVHRSLTDTEYPTVDSAIGKVCCILYYYLSKYM